MDDLGALERQWHLEVRLHVVLVYCHKHILISQVPQDVFRLGLEVRNHLDSLAYSVEEVTIASIIDADSLRASAIREDFDQGVLALMFGHESLVFDEVVNELPCGIDHQQERVSHGDVCDRLVGVSRWELDVILGLVLNAVQHNLAVGQDCGPCVVHDDLLDRTKVITLTD